MILRFARYLHRRLCRHYNGTAEYRGTFWTVFCTDCGKVFSSENSHVNCRCSLLPQEGDAP